MTYGLERLAMYVQGVENVYDLDFNGARRAAYGDVFLQRRAGIQRLQFRGRRHRRCCSAISPTPRGECARAAGARRLALPAYDQCIKASHLFNLLDARGVISVTERASYIGRVRALAKALLRGLAGDAAAGAEPALKD